MTQGFLYVASLSKCFHDHALASIISLKQCWPEAHVCLFTHKQWADEDRQLISSYVDILFTGIPAFVRAKLWALPRTPYDETCYIDADTYILSCDIKHIFSQRPRDKEVIMTCIRDYSARVSHFTEDGAEGPGRLGRSLNPMNRADRRLIQDNKTYSLKWHCGLFVYQKTRMTDRLWNLWLDTLLRHYYGTSRDGSGDPRGKYVSDIAPYARDLWFWDTFAFWRVLHENPDLAEIVCKFPAPDARWQWIKGYREWELQGTEIVVWHSSVNEGMRRRAYLVDSEIPFEWGDIKVIR